MNVRDTVETTLKQQGVPLASQYMQQYAEPVIEALEAREAEIVGNLTAYAVEQGLDRDTALSALDDCGLDLGRREPVEDPRIAEMERQIEAMQAQLRDLRG